MSAVFIMFPPVAGGNHYKNLLCLDQSFYNAKDFTESLYKIGRRTVHSKPGRNFNSALLSIANQENTQVIMHGHFAELATYSSDIRKILDKKFILIGLNDSEDFELLKERSKRIYLDLDALGDYYQSEQFFLYQPEICQQYFNTDIKNICCIKLSELWNPDLKSFDIIDRLNSFLDTQIDYDQAQRYHSVWYANNHLSNHHF